jgi:uncharacterized membrane protein
VLSAQRKSIDWSSWAAHWSAALGAIFLLAGVVFFFAWNWKELSPVVRFAILDGAVVLATAGALFCTKILVARQWLLTAAAVLTGVLVAVYGQVYQTGADAYEVFALWSVLMLGWVLVSRFVPLWLLWLAVLQTAVAMYFGQVLTPVGQIDTTATFLVLGLISGGSVVLREALATREQFSWLRGEWIRVALLASMLVWLTSIPWEMIFEYRWWNSVTPALRPFGLLVWAVAVILVMWLGRLIIKGNSDSAGGWLIVGILAILIFSGAAALIAKAAKFIADNPASTDQSDL